MSDTYIGPFGRILPVTDRPDSPQETPDLLNIPSRRHTAMCAAPAPAPPRLPLPVRLQFGSDPGPSFSDPHRYETANGDSRWPQPAPRPASNHDRLPSVNQLLVSTSHPPHGPAYTSNATTGSPIEHATNHGSPHRSTYPEYTRTDPGYFSPPYQGASHYVARASSSHGNGVYADSSNPRQTPTSAAYPDVHRDRTQSYPLPSAPSMPRHQSHSSDGSRGQPEQNSQRSELRTVAKPVRKFLREENIPGEGPCYVYEDGTRVRKTIDGEAVNVQWGVTKAGKPRKRLAIACITCREKKIKCEPAEPKCVQCDKSGRECRFQTALRGHTKDPKSPSYEQQAHTPTALSDGTEATFDSSRSDVGASLSPASPITLGSPSDSSFSSLNRKRLASISKGPKAFDLTKKARHVAEENGLTQDSSSNFTNAWSLRSDDFKNATQVDRLTDPYALHPGPTMHYIDQYFACFNNGRYNMFPREPFKYWLTSCKTKTPEELLTLYSMLTIGSIYSNKANAKSDGALFYKIAADEVTATQGIFTLQGVQSRLLLSFYCFAIGEYPVGWEICGTAYRIAIALRMHLEAPEDATDDDNNSFGFPTPMLAECYQRTFWIAFLFDRFQGFCVDHLCVLQKEDIFLRLPCNDQWFEESRISKAPFFDNGVIDDALVATDHSASGVSTMAFLIEVMVMSGDILQQTHRLAYQSPKVYATNYERFYRQVCERMDSWEENLPSFFQFNRDNMIRSIEGGYNDTFVTVHAMFHLTKVILNCRVRRSLLSQESLHRNIRTAFINCKQICSIMESLLSNLPSEDGINVSMSPPETKVAKPDGETKTAFGLLVPFLGLAAYYAADIISCAGPLNASYVKQVIGGLTSLLKISEHLGLYYSLVKGQCKNIRKRIEVLQYLATSELSGTEAWRFGASLQSNREEEFTLFYGESAAEMIFDVMDLKVAPSAVMVR